jgi:hypothetical protein
MAGSSGTPAGAGGGGIGGSSGAGIQTRVPSGWPQTCHLRGISRGRRGAGSQRGDGGGDAEDGTGGRREIFRNGERRRREGREGNGPTAREAFHPNKILSRFFFFDGAHGVVLGPLQWPFRMEKNGPNRPCGSPSDYEFFFFDSVRLRLGGWWFGKVLRFDMGVMCERAPSRSRAPMT